MTNCVLHMFSSMFSMLVMSIRVRSHFALVLSSLQVLRLNNEQKRFSSRFVNKNSLVSGIDLIHVFLCILTIRLIPHILSMGF